jgi:hypothetical protein
MNTILLVAFLLQLWEIGSVELVATAWDTLGIGKS